MNTYKLFFQKDPNSRMRGELIGCFNELAKAIQCAKEMRLEHFSIKYNSESWEF